jgi:hypothetical protein
MIKTGMITMRECMGTQGKMGRMTGNPLLEKSIMRKPQMMVEVRMVTSDAVCPPYMRVCQIMDMVRKSYNGNYRRHKRNDGHGRKSMHRGLMSTNRYSSDYDMTCSSSKSINGCRNNNLRKNSAIYINKLRTTGKRWRNSGSNYSTSSNSNNNSNHSNRIISAN